MVLSNSSTEHGKLEVELPEAFDLVRNLADETLQNENGASVSGPVNI